MLRDGVCIADHHRSLGMPSLRDVDDPRVQEYSEEVLQLACRRQGYAPDELFPPPSGAALIPLQSDAGGALSPRISEHIKAHADKRRRDKIESVIAEAQNIESAETKTHELVPHRSLAAADSLKLMKSLDSIPPSESRLLLRKTSSALLSAGHSMNEVMRRLNLPQATTKDKEEVPNTDEDTIEWVLPEGVEIPAWLDIDGDGEISQEEFEVFRKEILRAEKMKKQHVREMTILYDMEQKAKRLQDKADQTEYKLEKKRLEMELARKEKNDKERKKKRERAEKVKRNSEDRHQKKEEFYEEYKKKHKILEEKEKDRRKRLQVTAQKALEKRLAKVAKMEQEKDRQRRKGIRRTKERRQKLARASEIREQMAQERREELKAIATEQDKIRREKLQKVFAVAEERSEEKYQKSVEKEIRARRRVRSHKRKMKMGIFAFVEEKQQKQEMRKKLLGQQSLNLDKKTEKIQQKLSRKEEQVRRRNEEKRETAMEQAMRKQLRIKEKEENIQRDRRLKEYYHEAVRKEVKKQEEQLQRSRNHQEELLRHRRFQRAEAWKALDKTKEMFRLLKISNKGHNIMDHAHIEGPEKAKTGNPVPPPPRNSNARGGKMRTSSLNGIQSPLKKRSFLTKPKAKQNSLGPIDFLGLSPRAAKLADLSPYTSTHNLTPQYFTTKEKLAAAQRESKRSKGRKNQGSGKRQEDILDFQF